MDTLHIIYLLVLGSGIGLAAGLLGVGGGMILVPFLTLLLPGFGVPTHLVVHAAIATSMGTILFTSLSSMRAHQKRGAIRWDIVRVIVPGILVGGLFSGGAVFAAISSLMLATVFSVFVLYTAYSMFWGKPPQVGRTMPGPVGTAGMGVVIGFVSGLLGAGGGFLSIPFMVRGNIDMRKAVATSAALGFFIAIANSVGYVYSGFEQVQQEPGMLGYIYWPALVFVSITSILTAPLGASLAHRLPQKVLKRIFGMLLLCIAVYMQYTAYTLG